MRPSLHRSLPPELRLMPFNLRLMDLIGMREPWRRRFYRFLLAFSWGVLVIIFPKAVLGIGSKEFDAIAKGLAELLYQGNLYGAILIMVINMKTFETVIQLLSEIIRDVTTENQPKECYNLIREQTAKMNRFAKCYFIYCCIGPSIFCIPAMTTSYKRYFGARNASESLQFELPMEQEFYGLKIRTNFVNYNFFMACSLPAYYICSYLSVIKVTTLLIVIQYSALTYRLVAIRIRKLVNYSSNAGFKQSSKKVEEVVEIVQLHNKALKITDLVEKIVNIPVAMQFFCCVMFWCLVMVYVSKHIDSSLINVMVTFWLSLIETYGFAYLGTELTESSKAVGEAIYELNWYEDTVELQRYYRLMLQRSQRETGVTLAKFCIVGKEKFGKLVNTSYSFYLVLKDALNKL